MKQAGHSKRSYSRSAERQKQPQAKQLYTSHDGKGRGNPQQCVEKYLTLARDAASLGDPISAENYYQFADHYYRLVAAHRASRMSSSEKNPEKKMEGSESPSVEAPLPKKEEKGLE